MKRRHTSFRGAVPPGIVAGVAAALFCRLLHADAPAATAPATQAAPPATAPSPDDTAAAKPDLRELIGVNPGGLKRVAVPRLPSMTLRGYVSPQGSTPQALLEITELNRVFLVHVGTKIPITVQGSVAPLGRSELTGLADAPGSAAAAPNDANTQTQIILEVTEVTGEGVTVKAGLLSQTIIIK